MVRTNACQVERNGKKAGCALSALVGWHNHDCTPTAAATVMADGRLSICALRDIVSGKEVTPTRARPGPGPDPGPGFNPSHSPQPPARAPAPSPSPQP